MGAYKNIIKDIVVKFTNIPFEELNDGTVIPIEHQTDVIEHVIVATKKILVLNNRQHLTIGELSKKVESCELEYK